MLATDKLQAVIALGDGWVYGVSAHGLRRPRSASGWDDGGGDDC